MKFTPPTEESPRAFLHCPHCGQVVLHVSIAPLLAAWSKKRKSIELSIDALRGFAGAAVAQMAAELWNKED